MSILTLEHPKNADLLDRYYIEGRLRYFGCVFHFS